MLIFGDDKITDELILFFSHPPLPSRKTVGAVGVQASLKWLGYMLSVIRKAKMRDLLFLNFYLFIPSHIKQPQSRQTYPLSLAFVSIEKQEAAMVVQAVMKRMLFFCILIPCHILSPHPFSAFHSPAFSALFAFFVAKSSNGMQSVFGVNSAQTVLRTATLKQNIKLVISPTHSILTPRQAAD